VLLAEYGFGLDKLAERELGHWIAAKPMVDNPLAVIVPLSVFDYPCASEF
jgi:hypothetical protein